MSSNTPYYVAAGAIGAAIAAVVIIKSKALCPYIPQLPGCGTDDGGGNGGGGCDPACVAPEECIYNACVDTTVPPDECAVNADCLSTERCDSGQCVPLNAPIQGQPEIRTFIDILDTPGIQLEWFFPKTHLSTITGQLTIVDPHPGHWISHSTVYVTFYALRDGVPTQIGQLVKKSHGIIPISFTPGMSGVSGIQAIITKYNCTTLTGCENRLRLKSIEGEMVGWR